MIHDNYNGTAHCVECEGSCKLTGSDRHLTAIVRALFETRHHTRAGTWMSPVLRSALEAAGVDIAHHQRRAAETC